MTPPFGCAFDFFVFAKNRFKERSNCAAHREKRFSSTAASVLISSGAADVYNSQQLLLWFSGPAWKGHPSTSSQLNLLAHFFLSLSKADWSGNPQGLQETVSEQDLLVEV